MAGLAAALFVGYAVGQDDDRAAQEAADQATKYIESGLKQLGADLSQNLDEALGQLSGKVNEAVAAQTAETAQGSGG